MWLWIFDQENKLFMYPHETDLWLSIVYGFHEPDISNPYNLYLLLALRQSWDTSQNTRYCIIKSFPEDRDCLYYVLMGLNSIPDKQRAGAETVREREHIQAKMMWWLTVTEQRWWQIVLSSFSNKPFNALQHAYSVPHFFVLFF